MQIIEQFSQCLRFSRTEIKQSVVNVKKQRIVFFFIFIPLLSINQVQFVCLSFRLNRLIFNINYAAIFEPEFISDMLQTLILG